MPWRGPEVPGEFPTLGYAVAELIEAKCAIPDGARAGDPFVLTDEMLLFLLHLYRIDPATGLFVHRRGAQLVRPQKWGKGPFSAAWICAEADPDGPVLPAGWDANGEPVGRPWPTPWIQVTAVSEDQTANVWRALVPMIELGSIRADMPDTGETRINLPNGGRIEPVTSSARSRLGQRITAALEDETHSWLERNGGRQLADNQRRNLAGMGGRFLETTNAWDPREESVAQQTAEGNEPGVYRDDVEPGTGSVRNKVHRRRMLRRVYGDSLIRAKDDGKVPGWVDPDRIDDEIIALLKRDPSQAERFFLNRKQAGEDAVFDVELVAGRHVDFTPPRGDLVVVGVDGARFVDAIGMVATHVDTGHQWPLGIWERPPFADDGYEHPFDEVDGALAEAIDMFDVWRVYIDPQYIDHLVDAWQGRWGDDRIVKWFTSRPRQAAFMVRSYVSAWGSGDASHNADTVFLTHLRQARKHKLNVYDDDHRQMFTMSKDRPDSPRKIDAAMAGGLSWEARGDCIAAGKPRARTRSRVPVFFT